MSAAARVSFVLLLVAGCSVIGTKSQNDSSEVGGKIPDVTGETTTQQVEDLEPVVRSVLQRVYREAYSVLSDVMFDPGIPTECASAYQRIFLAANRFETWALEFFLTSGGVAPMVEGQFADEGLYDACLDIKVPLNSEGRPPFNGQYCTMFMVMRNPFIRRIVGQSLKDYPEVAVFVRNDTDILLDYLALPGMRLGLCVPSTCSGDTIEYAVSKLAGNYGARPWVPVCRSFDTDPPVSPFQLAVICLIVVLCCLVGLATYVDVRTADGRFLAPTETPGGLPGNTVSISKADAELRKGMALDIVRAFSLRSNWKILFRAPSKTASNHYSSIHGIRVISCVYVLWGHIYMVLDPTSLRTPLHIMRWFRNDILFVPVYMGFYVVDSFFCISGLLLYSNVRKELIKKRPTPIVQLIPTIVVRRWIRLAFPSIAVVAFSELWPRLFSGPTKDLMIDVCLQGCRERWWAVLGMFNNLYSPEKQCLLHFWYIAADYQIMLMLLIPVILLARQQTRKIGFIIVVLMLIASCVYGFAATLLWNLPPIMLPLPLFIRKLPATIQYVYERPTTHLSAAAVGVIFGYLTEEYLEGTLGKISESFWRTGWLLVPLVGVANYFIPFHWQSGSDGFTAWAALWVGTSRAFWALFIAWLIFSSAASRSGPVRRILSLPILVPLSRLSYCFYLSHMLVVATRAMLQRNTYEPSHYLLAKFALSDVVISYFFAFVVFVLVEAPVTRLEKLLFENLAARNRYRQSALHHQNQKHQQQQQQHQQPKSQQKTSLDSTSCCGSGKEASAVASDSFGNAHDYQDGRVPNVVPSRDNVVHYWL